MTEQEQIVYLANCACIAFADSQLSPKETAAIEEIRIEIGAKKATLNAAMKAAQSDGFNPVKVGSFAKQVCNAADMLYLCFVDGELDTAEKTIITAFCKKIGITQDQLNFMAKEAISRADQAKLKLSCPSCNLELPVDAKFCTKCGTPIGSVDAEPAITEFSIPVEGYSIEFCESGAATFPDALKHGKTSPNFQSLIKNKKTWYLASWGASEFDDVTKLAKLLSGIRNRKAYVSGKETAWDELFAFTYCAGERAIAYKPIEYCFGKDDNQLNPWGCKQTQMAWTEWARWFSYGEFKKVGVVKAGLLWTFDKEKIKHEITNSLHRFRYCPHIRIKLVDAVMRALPDQIDVSSDKNWAYNRIYEEVPGCIKVVEVTKQDGYTDKEEYFVDGVRPKGLLALKEILTKAFKEANVTDISADQIVK